MRPSPRRGCRLDRRLGRVMVPILFVSIATAPGRCSVGKGCGRRFGRHGFVGRALVVESGGRASPTPLLHPLPPHRRRVRVFHLEPVARPAVCIARTATFAHDVLAAKLARLLEDDRAGVFVDAIEDERERLATGQGPRQFVLRGFLQLWRAGTFIRAVAEDDEQHARDHLISAIIAFFPFITCEPRRRAAESIGVPQDRAPWRSCGSRPPQILSARRCWVKA
jgi:hypothetical protein